MTEVKRLNLHQILKQVSLDMSDALLYIHYEQIDEKNHKSLNSLVHYLQDIGQTEVAELLNQHAHYLEFFKPMEAMKLYHLINDHSVAINATLVYAGLENQEAEHKIKKDFLPKEVLNHIKQLH